MMPHTHGSEASRPTRLSELSAAYSPEFIAEVMRLIEPWYHGYFRCEVRGLENIPSSPAFLVGNHNGGGVVEIPLFLYAWYMRFGLSRPLLGLAHQAVFKFPWVKDLLPKIGAVPAAPDVARKILAAGKDLAVFPGGDWEAGRPTSERTRIDFAGRKGFVRTALQAGVPVVPIVITGAHETGIILSRGTELAKALGLDRTERMKAFPLWVFPPILPSKITIEVLGPIHLAEELAGIEDEEEKLARGYALVTTRMQQKMDELYRARAGFLG